MEVGGGQLQSWHWDPASPHSAGSFRLTALKLGLSDVGFGEGERQEGVKERGVENGLWLARSRPWRLSDFPFASDLYSSWVLVGWPCQAIHVVGSWLFVCPPLLLPLLFSLEWSYLTVQSTAYH